MGRRSLCYYHFPDLTAFINRKLTMRRVIHFLPDFLPICLPVFLLACLLSTGAVRSQTTTVSNSGEPKQALQLKLDEWHKAGSFPGATLGVVLPSGESFGLAVGVSDRETRTPMRPNDRMLAGSVGKTFAAATALQLVREGKIDSTTESKNT